MPVLSENMATQWHYLHVITPKFIGS